jgi:hypothetical protein
MKYILALLLALTAFGQQPKTDFTPTPKSPAPPLPAANNEVPTDAYGSRILRLTDATDGERCDAAYSYWPAFNVNSTRIAVECVTTKPYYASYTMVYDWDASTFRYTKKTKHVDMANLFWSEVDPDVIYALKGTKLNALNVVTGKLTTIKDFATVISGYSAFQGHVSSGDQRFSFSKRQNGYAKGYVVWERATDKILINRDDAHDEVQIANNPRYLRVVYPGSSDPLKIEGRIIDIDAGTEVTLTDGPPDYNNGHSDIGNRIMVGEENWNGFTVARTLDNPKAFWPLVKTASWHSGMSGHQSLADDESWVLLSTYGKTTGKPMQGEIMLLATDGSQRVFRIAQHHSTYIGYYDTVRASISKDAKWVVFTSNWGATVANSRRDVFVLKVPDGIYAPPPPPPSVVSVSVTPATATLKQSEQHQFTADVSVISGASTSVTWTASAGTIDSTGLFTAPASIAAQQDVTITATSDGDATKIASAVVTLVPPPPPPPPPPARKVRVVFELEENADGTFRVITSTVQ